MAHQVVFKWRAIQREITRPAACLSDIPCIFVGHHKNQSCTLGYPRQSWKSKHSQCKDILIEALEWPNVESTLIGQLENKVMMTMIEKANDYIDSKESIMKPCKVCNGKGVINVSQHGWDTSVRICPPLNGCNGTGINHKGDDDDE